MDLQMNESKNEGVKRDEMKSGLIDGWIFARIEKKWN